MLTIKVSIRSLLFVIVLIALWQNAFAQTDTVPVLLQSRIIGIEPSLLAGEQINQLQYAAPDMVFASEEYLSNSQQNILGYLHVSVNGGRSFISRDSVIENYGLPKSYILYRIERLTGHFQISHDTGKTWSTPEDLNRYQLPFNQQISYSVSGARIAIANLSSGYYQYTEGNYDLAYTSDNHGLGWNTSWWKDTSQIIKVQSEPIIRWADENNGLIVTQNSVPAFHHEDTAIIPTNAYVAITSDGGISWRRVIQQGDPLYDLLWPPLSGFDVFYPFPSTILIRSEYGNQVSLDTGHTWQSLPAESPDFTQQILCVTPGRWLACLSNGWSNDLNYDYGVSIAPTMSTDNGNTWKPVKYKGQNPITLMSFKDTLNGIACDGYDIVARTSDGGFTWETVDSSDYMYGRVSRALGLDSAYYSFSPFADTNLNGAYGFFTRDRGATWKNIFKDQQGYAFAGLDSAFWVGGTGFARIASLYGEIGNTFIFSNRDSTRITAIDKNFVWVSDANELHPAMNNDVKVEFDNDVAKNIHGYDSSLSYNFLPIDRNVVYVRAPDTIYVTKDAGKDWSVAKAMPSVALNATNWFIFSADTSSLLYTSDGGATFKTITIPNANTRSILPVDSLRWYVNGFFTTNAGLSWQRISGWDNKLGLYIVDSTAAFGEPLASTAKKGQVQILWRLDLPTTIPPLQGIVSESPLSVISNATASPNPAVEGTVITFGLVQATYVKINLFNVLGEQVTSPGYEGLFQPGNHAVPLSLQGLPSGTYYARILTAYGGVATVKLVKE